MFEKFALVPRFSRVKSFYKKAMIRPFPGGLILYSYGTPVCTVCDEKIFRYILRNRLPAGAKAVRPMQRDRGT